MTSIYILIAAALIGLFLFYMYMHKSNTVDSDSNTPSNSVPNSTSTITPSALASPVELSALTEEDLTEGWYYGTEKRPGTPDTWVFQGGGTRSARWVDPSRHAIN